MIAKFNADVYRKICVVIAVAVFFTNFSDYSERWNFKALYWIYVLVLLSAPLVVGSALSASIPIRPLMIWCAGFLMMTMLWYFPSNQDKTAYQELQTRFLSVIFLLLILFLFSRPAEQRLARATMIFAVLFGVGLNIYELFNPLTFSNTVGRSAGLFVNSNQSAAGLMIGMILGYSIVPKRLKFLFVVVAGVGIFTTFSRSAMVIWVVAVVFFVARSRVGLRELRNTIVFAAVVLAFVFSPVWENLQTSLEKRGTLNVNVIQRINFLSNGSAQDDSAEERKRVVEAGWRMFEAKPYLGHGTGASLNIPGFTISTHNIYVSNLIDHGILGLFIVPALLLAASWGTNRTTFDLVAPWLLFMGLWGLFSHNVLEERFVLLGVALMASIVTSARRIRVEQPSFIASALSPELLPGV